MGIANRYSTPSYPQGNRQAEATNKSIVNGLKRKLDDSKRKWTKKLLRVLWSYQTTLRRSMGKTPFSIGLPTSRIDQFKEEENNHLMGKQLDLTEENHEILGKARELPAKG